MFKTATSADLPDIDFQQLDRELDRVKAKVFINSSGAFLGPLMCSMRFAWSTDLPTAATDGNNIWWNPVWFLSLPKETRQTVLLHELWHPAYLHMLRCDGRDPKVWNQACDIVINNILDDEKQSFAGTSPWLNHDYDGMHTEEIYDILIKDPEKQCAPWGPGTEGDPEDASGGMDLIPGDAAAKQQIVNNVVKAVHSAKLNNAAGSIPGAVQLTLNKFLAPKVPWETLLMQFFTDMLDEDYTWRRPNRRAQDMYLPSRYTDDGRLAHLCYYLDVSGSISDQDILRFNSEVKYIKDVLKPERLDLIQFDTQIQKIDTFYEDDPFEEILVIGRGGTCLIEVRQHIMDNNPTAAVIFTDMGVAPMESGPDCPIIWICSGNPGATVPFGKLIHITS